MTSELWSELNDEIENKLKTHKLDHPDPKFENSPDDRLTRMNSYIQGAIQKCVPSEQRLSTIKRTTSEATIILYEARAQKFIHMVEQKKAVTKQLLKRWNGKIRDANLSDYNVWLDGLATEMEEA